MESISAAIQSTPAKKESLRKAFEDVRSHSSALASFALQWKDLEAHFDSIHSSIESRFRELEAKEKAASKACPPPAVEDSKSNRPVVPSGGVVEPAVKREEFSVGQEEGAEPSVRPELKLPCVKMDAHGLRRYIVNNRQDIESIREEVVGALRCAADPAKLVLDAMGGFYRPDTKGDKDLELAAIRRSCILLLEKFSSFPKEIKARGREQANALAMEWKGKITGGGQNPLEAKAFLQLILTFDLSSSFSWDELIDLIADLSRRKQIVDLCCALVPSENIPHLIEKLISKGKQLDAVNYAYTFGVVDKFPPVPLLKTYLSEAKKLAIEIRRKGGNSTMYQNEAIAKEVSAIKAVVKCIEERKLESEFSPEILQKQIAEIESRKPEKKRPAAHQQLPMKRPRSAAPPLFSPGITQAAQSLNAQQPWPALLDRVPTYLAPASAGSYGVITRPTIGGPGHLSGGSGILGGSPLGLGASRSPTRSHLYHSESYMPSVGGLYDRSVNLSGGLNPQYPPFFS